MKQSRRQRAMTLLELILVMFLLATIMALSAPTLSRFFHARDVEEEARRFLALARHAPNRAVSEGAPMELWIDPVRGAYGLSPQVGFEAGADVRLDVRFQLFDGVHITADEGLVGDDGEVTLLFQPDGSADVDNPERLLLWSDRGEAVEIAQVDVGFGYAIAEVRE